MTSKTNSSLPISFPVFGWNSNEKKPNKLYLNSSTNKIEKLLHSNAGKIISICPIVVGLPRLYCVITNDKRLHAGNNWVKSGHLVRGTLETVGLGALCLIIDTIVWLFKKCVGMLKSKGSTLPTQKPKPQPQFNPTNSSPHVSSETPSSTTPPLASHSSSPTPPANLPSFFANLTYSGLIDSISKASITDTLYNSYFIIKRDDFSDAIESVSLTGNGEALLEETRKNSQVAQEITSSMLLKETGAVAKYVSPPSLPCPIFENVEIDQSFFASNETFFWDPTRGVKGDIIRDGNRVEDNSIVYGVASQFNGCEAVDRKTITPGQAVEGYKNDRTQGPQAQLAFNEKQVELINCGGHMGFNGLADLLDADTIPYILHGYFTPEQSIADKVIHQLKNEGHLIKYLAVSNYPQGDTTKKPVDMVLVAAPAFGSYEFFDYEKRCTIAQKREIQFLFALHSYRAQFVYCIQKAQETGQPVVFKAAATGLGAFENEPIAVAKAFYQAATEFQKELNNNHVTVRFQTYGTRGRGVDLVNLLKPQ